jgi:peptidyl-prolyl cis-trans isomerase SurA
MLDDSALDVATETLEQRDSTFADLMKEYRDGIVLFRVMEDSVWNRASSDSVGLATHYESNASRYNFGVRSRILSFTATSDSLLSAVASSWVPGSSTDWSAMFEGDTRFRIDTTHIADSTRSVYDTVLGVPVGETRGPVSYRSGYVLLAVDGIEAPRRKTMDEARAEVLSEHQRVVEDAWLSRLHDRYNAKLYPDKLVRAFVAPPSDGSSE